MSIQLSLPIADAPTPAPGDYLTIAEAARRVRCCERTIRRAIDSGELRAGRLRSASGSRGTVRIRSADLDTWVFGDGS
jgi:excisionase family DNA binding protein